MDTTKFFRKLCVFKTGKVLHMFFNISGKNLEDSLDRHPGAICIESKILKWVCPWRLRCRYFVAKQGKSHPAVGCLLPLPTRAVWRNLYPLEFKCKLKCFENLSIARVLYPDSHYAWGSGNSNLLVKYEVFNATDFEEILSRYVQEF